MTDVSVQWQRAIAGFAEQSHAPDIQKDFSDGVGEHKDIGNTAKDQRDVLLLSGWWLLRCKTLTNGKCHTGA